MPATLSTTTHSSCRRSWFVLPLLAIAINGPTYAQTTAPAVSTVLSLSGSRTFGGVVLGPGGDLYGASTVTIGGSAGGIIFKVAPDATSIETVYQLGENDGISPQTGLLLASDGKLYGTTHFGVTADGGGPGTLFRVQPDGTGFTTLHKFATSTTTNQDSNPKNTDGAFPDSLLIEGSDGLLYGVTRAGGANGTGTVFKIGKDGTGFTTLHVFGAITSTAASGLTANTDGAYPAAGLIESNGYFYGTTSRGGVNARGVVFRLRFDGSEFGAIHVFTNIVTPTGGTIAVNEDGAAPVASLLDGQNGLLYGVTTVGGEDGVGTLFSITPDGATFTTLHDFETPNGSQPAAALMLGTDGKLYGTTANGGTNSSGSTTNAGTIFSMALDGTAFTKIVSLDGSAGASPNSALLQLSSTLFVGTTGSGGRCGEGTVFQLSLTGATLDGFDSCGGSNNDNGGGVTSPMTLLLLLGGGLAFVRRRRLRSTDG